MILLDLKIQRLTSAFWAYRVFFLYLDQNGALDADACFNINFFSETLNRDD